MDDGIISIIKNKFEPYKVGLLASVGAEPKDNRTDEEKAVDYLKEEFENAKFEYKQAVAYYNESENECAEYAIQHVNTCMAKLDCIIKQLKNIKGVNEYGR